MTDVMALAQSWLMPKEYSFWIWDDCGQVISWSDQRTIIFREELATVVQRLVPRGLPPTDALLLLLAVTRDNWQPSYTTQFLSALLRPSDLIENVAQALQKVADLDPALRQSPQAKAEIAALVFEDSHLRGSQDVAEEILQILSHRVPSSIFSSQVALPLNQVQERLIRDLHLLERSLLFLDEDALRLRLRTGLESDIAPMEAELPIAEAVRRMLTVMDQDEELYHLAFLTRRLMAALTLPRKLSQPEELPLGGVSDIANRGQLDRLLLSELAYDDLTLAVRIANNEALYYRRESPPQCESRHRILILDSGLRAWGAPRVFIASVALALAATTEAEHSLACYRAEGRSLIPVELSDVEGIRSHLEALSAEAHPGWSLSAIEELLASVDGATDLVLITTEDAEADPDFHAAMATVNLVPMMMATVNREGDFHLELRTLAGRKSLRRTRLDLEAALASKKKTRPLIDPDVPEDLPVIIGVKPFPLYLAHPIDFDRFWEVEGEGAFAITNDARLMFWRSSGGVGAKQIAEELPHRTLLWAQTRATGGRVHAVLGRRHHTPVYLLQIHLGTMTCTWRELPVTMTRFETISSSPGAVLVISREQVEAFSMITGESLGSTRPTRVWWWGHGRFFSDPKGWYAVTTTPGSSLEFTWIVSEDRALDAGARPIGIVDSTCREGPIVILANGDIYDPVKHEVLALDPHPIQLDGMRVLKVSHSGDRILIGIGDPRHSVGTDGHYLLDVKKMTRNRAYGKNTPVEPMPSFIHQRTYRNRFRALAWNPDQDGFYLLGRRASIFQVGLRSPQGTIQLEKARPSLPVQGRKFEPVPLPARKGPMWHVAKLPENRLVYLDPRGMLHLKWKGSLYPEVTLVLDESGMISGWCSNGIYFGDPYFTDQTTNPEVTESVWHNIIAPFFKGLS